jgi:hypothetical protein
LWKQDPLVQLQRPLAVVTPTLDGDVLQVLAQADHRFTVGAIQKLLFKGSYEGIRKALRRLTDQGIVDDEYTGTVYTFALNREHLAAEHIIALAQLQTTVLTRISQHIRSWERPPVYAAVFGSAVAGRMRPDSDIDILVVRPDNADDGPWDDQRIKLERDVTRWTGNDSRVLEMTEAEVRAGAGSDPVLDSVAKQGVTVAGERSWLVSLLSRARVR